MNTILRPDGIDNYIEIRKSQLNRWAIFFKERFEPISHFVMIALFVYAHYLVADASKDVVVEPHLILYIGLGTAVFFMKLRLYDEIKDFEVDVAKNPDRPLPRGLLQHLDIKKGIELCIILEVIFFTSCGINALTSILLAIGYSLLMYKEFFIPNLIRPVAIFSALSKQTILAIESDFIYFSVMSWLLFNIFELGRKIYQPCEEREGVDTYSSIWGKFGAVMLVLVQALAASYLVLHITTIQYYMMVKLLLIQLGLLALVGIIYLIGKTETTGKLFRHYSSVYILLVYVSLIGNYFYRDLL